MTAIALPPTSQQKTAPVHEYHCTFTHDVKRKNAKRWKDGFLKFHTFNNRLLVYDESRNFVQAGHQVGGADGIYDGAELTLDLVLIQVGEPKGVTQTDLSEVVKKKSPKRATEATPRPKARLLHHSPIARHGTSLRTVIASSATGANPSQSAYPVERPSKRPRRDDNHKPLREMLNSNNKPQTPLPPAPSAFKISLQERSNDSLRPVPTTGEERQRATVDLTFEEPPINVQVTPSKSSTSTRVTKARENVSKVTHNEIRAVNRHPLSPQRTSEPREARQSPPSSAAARKGNLSDHVSKKPPNEQRRRRIFSQSSSEDEDVPVHPRSMGTLDFHAPVSPQAHSRIPSDSSRHPIKRINLRKTIDERSSSANFPPPTKRSQLEQEKDVEMPGQAQRAKSPVKEQKKTRALRLKSRPQRRMLCQALEDAVARPEPQTTKERPSEDHRTDEVAQATPADAQLAQEQLLEARSMVANRIEAEAEPARVLESGREEESGAHADEALSVQSKAMEAEPVKLDSAASKPVEAQPAEAQPVESQTRDLQADEHDTSNPDKTFVQEQAVPASPPKPSDEDVFSLFVADDFAYGSSGLQASDTAAKEPIGNDTPDASTVLVSASQVEELVSSPSLQSSGKTATVDPRALSLQQQQQQQQQQETVKSSQQSAAPIEAEVEDQQMIEACEADREAIVAVEQPLRPPPQKTTSSGLRRAASDLAPLSQASLVSSISTRGGSSSNQRRRAPLRLLRRHQTIGHAAPLLQEEELQEQEKEGEEGAEGAEEGEGQTAPYEQGPWTVEAWDLLGGCPAEVEQRLGWGRRYGAAPL